MNNTRVAVIGGGYAGMSAAVELSRHDLDVTVFESSATLGGRARAIEAGLSNGRHILMGAYTETLRLLRFLGVSPRLLWRIPFVVSTPGRMRMEASSMPAPFGPVLAILRARGLRGEDRLALFRLLKHLGVLRHTQHPDSTVSLLLTTTRQTALLRELLWEPFCLAALGTTTERASAQAFTHALQDLIKSASSSELLIPRVDMSELLPVPATLYLSRHGNAVRTLTSIERIRLDANRFVLDGDNWEGSHYSHVIVATQADAARRLLADFETLILLREQLARLETEAITTVYLAYQAEVSLPDPIIQVSGSIVRNLIDCGTRKDGTSLLAGVIRTKAAHLGKADDAFVLETHWVLELMHPRLPLPCWNKVVTERKAAYPSTPDVVRPRTITAVRNLLLAGDYVESPCPANIESAVRSGLAAAHQILRGIGRPV